MANCVWVVEMLDELSGEWFSTVGTGLTRRDARDEQKNWEARNPSDKFRIRRYIPEASNDK